MRSTVGRIHGSSVPKEQVQGRSHQSTRGRWEPVGRTCPVHTDPLVRGQPHFTEEERRRTQHSNQDPTASDEVGATGAAFERGVDRGGTWVEVGGAAVAKKVSQSVLGKS